MEWYLIMGGICFGLSIFYLIYSPYEEYPAELVWGYDSRLKRSVSNIWHGTLLVFIFLSVVVYPLSWIVLGIMQIF